MNQLCTLSGNDVNWCKHYGKQYVGSLKIKKKKTELPYDPAMN